MKWARCAITALALGGCSDNDGPPIDDANTCIVTVDDSFSHEQYIFVLHAQGRPATNTWYRDNIEQSRWTYTYDDAGQLIREEQDCCGGEPSGPDGIVDIRWQYEHTPTTTLARQLGTDDVASASIEMTVDSSNRILRVTQGRGATTTGEGSFDYTLDEDGAVVRRELAGTDPDLGPFTHVDTFRYDAGRLLDHTMDYSPNNPPRTRTFTYQTEPEGLEIRWSTFGNNPVGAGGMNYRYDAQGRITRIEEIEPDSTEIRIDVDVSYGDGAVTTSMTNLTNTDLTPRVRTYSRACQFAPTAPTLPSSGMRPGMGWTPPREFVFESLER